MDDQFFEVNLIENLTSEHNEEIELEVECDYELGFDDLNLDEIVNSTVERASTQVHFIRRQQAWFPHLLSHPLP